MLPKLLLIGALSMTLTGALLSGPGSTPFSQVPSAGAVEITCSDGSSPTCNPIFDGQGHVIGYSCICG